jgi:hypothetical protein
MRISKGLALAVFLLLSPSRGFAQPITLSQLLADIATHPKTVQQVLARLGDSTTATGVISAEQLKSATTLLLKKDWRALEYFPTSTLESLGKNIERLGKKKLTGNDKQADFCAQPLPPEAKDGESVREPLGIPTGKPPLIKPQPPKDLGQGITHGGLVDPQRSKHYADSERLACVLNRLARNVPGKQAIYEVQWDKKVLTSPQEVVKALQTDHELVVRDVRFCANFGKLRYKDKDVLTPFWLDTEVPVPGKTYTLRVPGAHSEHELIVRGPKVNVEVYFFFGIDGEAKFRPKYATDQQWVGRRVVYEYKGDKAREAIRLAGEVRRTFLARQKKYPDLPLGGYFVLGVCNDVNAVIEYGLNKRVTQYPLTHDPAYFQGEGEVDKIMRALPLDGRDDASPDLDRILGSLPETEIQRLPFRHLREDLERVLKKKK